MDRELLDFLEGKTNAVRLGNDLVLSRDIAPNGYHQLYITPIDGDVPLYKFWHNPKHSNKDSPPKHIGGKKPYLMLMTQEIVKLREQGVTNVEELVGFLACMSSTGNIEWGTGRLIKKRSKKPLRYEDLLKLFSGGRTKLNRILSELKEHDLLFNTQEGYFISTRFIKKGKTK